jgi:hypothetical protein
MLPDTVLSNMIRQIYEAATDSNKWIAFLEECAPAFRSDVATIHF